jgi:hypothetical protein
LSSLVKYGHNKQFKTTAIGMSPIWHPLEPAERSR